MDGFSIASIYLFFLTLISESDFCATGTVTALVMVFHYRDHTVIKKVDVAI